MNPLATRIREKAGPCLVRECQSSDHDRCLEIYRSNEGMFIAPGYIDEFIQFLAEPTSYFFVIEDAEQKIVGCGGIELYADYPNLAGLTFGMIEHSSHRSQ